jgi:tetratricopeptide (TPR) repeat protein
MRELDLDSAVREIVEAYAYSAQRGVVTPPFFFVAGAGVSYPTIPTAVELQEECKREALKKGRSTEPTSTYPMDVYSHWFEAAWPHSDQRRGFLEEKMKQKRISLATLRLAQIVQDGRIGRIVVTPNFDDFLSRALSLFGVSPVVCDHPGTIRRLDVNSPNRQILHVHGSYWFYDCCNLKGEISRRASPKDSVATVSSFLSHILWERSPIILGYSGWENDVIMTALQARLIDQVLPFNIYWFCYRSTEHYRLPRWLSDHENVRFVVPTGNETDALTAEKVLSCLISRLGMAAPSIFKDPLRFFAKQLQDAIDISEHHEESSADPYHFKDVIDQVLTADVFVKSAPPKEPKVILLERLRNAHRRADSVEVIRICKTINVEDLNQADKDGLVDALMMAATNLPDAEIALELEGYELVEVLAGSKGGDQRLSDTCLGALVHAYFRKGIVLRKMSRISEAILAFETCIKHGTGLHDMPGCSVIADALFCMGLAQSDKGLLEQAIETYDELWARFGSCKDAHLRQLLARARTNSGVTIEKLGDNEKALSVYRDVVKEFGDEANETNIGVCEPVAKALVNTSTILAKSGDNESAIGLCEDVKKRFIHMEFAPLRDPVAKALANRGIYSEKQGRHKEAFDAYDEAIDYLERMPDEDLSDLSAWVLNRKGRLFGIDKRPKEALAVFERIISRFGAMDNPAVKKEVAQAIKYRQIALEFIKDTSQIEKGDASSDEEPQ